MEKMCFAICLLFGGFHAAGAESFTQRLCYSGCTFDGLEKARRACRADREGEFCELSPFCTFPNIVLETKFIVH